MEKIIEKCYFNLIKKNPSKELIKEIQENLPACITYIADILGTENKEVEELTFLFIHSNYK